jgi:hypothetical protein
MANLDALKIKHAPKCFGEMKDMHNALCDLVGGIEGNLGIDVHIVAPAKRKIPGTKATRPKGGKIRIAAKKVFGQTGNAGGAGATGDATELHYNAGGVTIDIDGGGFNMTFSGFTVTLEPGGAISTTDGTHTVTFSASGEILINTGTNTLSLAAADITEDMSIKTFTGCNSGTPGSYLTIASDFF